MEKKTWHGSLINYKVKCKSIKINVRLYHIIPLPYTSLFLDKQSYSRKDSLPERQELNQFRTGTDRPAQSDLQADPLYQMKPSDHLVNV